MRSPWKYEIQASISSWILSRPCWHEIPGLNGCTIQFQVSVGSWYEFVSCTDLLVRLPQCGTQSTISTLLPGMFWAYSISRMKEFLGIPGIQIISWSFLGFIRSIIHLKQARFARGTLSIFLGLKNAPYYIKPFFDPFLRGHHYEIWKPNVLKYSHYGKPVWQKTEHKAFLGTRSPYISRW